MMRSRTEYPAKFSYRLVQRIVTFGLQQRFWSKGDLIGDPFGGVALGGIVAAYAGIRWIGCELESRFCELGRRNLELHRGKWETLAKFEGLGDIQPVMIQGDSRQFAALVAESLSGIVTSPPFSEPANQPRGQHQGVREYYSEKGVTTYDHYGTTEGQIGSLPSGNLDAIVTSPPFSPPGNQPIKRNGSTQAVRSEYAKIGESPTSTYGTTEGQIGALAAGDLQGVITSPPYESSDQVYTQTQDCKKRLQKRGEPKNGCGLMRSKHSMTQDYGSSPGQLGNTSGDNYWSAMRDVYTQMRLAMRPGAVAAIVVKAFVKNGKIVDLPEQTCQLLTHLGFDVFLRVHAMLTQETKENDLFEKVTTKKTKRASFFRRLYEQKYPENAIDFEEVIWCRTTASPSDEHTSRQ